jgi:DNA modification methylase
MTYRQAAETLNGTLSTEPQGSAGAECLVTLAERAPDVVRAGKNTTIYGVHSYSTKVPYQAITPFIERFTKPGDLVLDPFCGSGMTGVAAILRGRRARLSDISTAAIHIASNYVTPCDAAAFLSGARRIDQAAEAELAELYETSCDRCGATATIEYTVWSDVFGCPACDADISYWQSAVDLAAGTVKPLVTCATCRKTAKKADLPWRRSVPVSTKYSCRAGCGRMVERAVNDRELALSARIEAEPITDWYPTAPFGAGREMWRKSHEVMGITSVDGFYTRRNLRALAALWRLVNAAPDDRVRQALRFAFTAMVNRASRRYQWNAKRPTNVQTGTLYISSLNYEWNVLSLLRRKLRDVHTYYAAHPRFPGNATVVRDSATRLAGLAENSVDYIYTDPPFGANIYYADCALLWESWIGEYTDPRDEILIHTKQRGRGGNSLADYERLMTQAFTRMRQVLKPGGMASVVFHSSHADVWRSVQDAVGAAGFELLGTTALDKGQPSIKGLKGQRGDERVAAVDVILSLRKPVGASIRGAVAAPELDVRGLIREALTAHLASLPERIASAPGMVTNDMRRLQHLHTLAVRTLLERGVAFRAVSFAFVESLCVEHFIRREEFWYLPPEPAVAVPPPTAQLDLLPNAGR